MRTYASLGGPLLAAALAVGCAGAGPASLAPNPAAQGDSLAAAPMLQTVLNRYNLEIDTVAGSARFTPVRPRLGADNADVYRLPIDPFYAPDTLIVNRVSIDFPDNEFVLEYTWKHPFADSATSNRADLGVSGILCFLTDVDSATGHTYFDGADPVIVNPAMVSNPDGFFQPRGLIGATGTVTNTFPYRLLVDDAGTGNRIDGVSDTAIPNGGVPTGNYTAPNGWQTGTSKTWTGYDVIHQGQAATNELRLDLDELSGTPTFSFEVATIAKYNDPRSGTPPKAHRLPSTPTDFLTGFGYRMPHGAWDVSQVTFEGEGGGFTTNQISGSELRFHVRDFDARATESGEPNLADDPDGTNVTAGASGMPAMEVCIPGVLGDATVVTAIPTFPVDDDSSYGGDVTEDTGMAGDELFFAATVSKSVTSGQADGTYQGLVRVTDVEAGNESYLFNLDGSLAPVTANLPEPVTYQAFSVSMTSPMPVGDGWANGFGNPLTTTVRAIATDDLGNVYVGGTSTGTSIDFGGGAQALTTPSGFVVAYNNAGLEIWHRVTNNSDVFGLAVDAGGKVWATGTFTGASNFGFGAVSPTGTQDGFMMDLAGGTGATTYGTTWGSPAGTTTTADMIIGFAQYPTIVGTYTGTIDFGMGPHVASGARDIYWISYLPNAVLFREKVYTGTGTETPTGVAATSSGDAFVVGQFTGTTDFGNGPLNSAGAEDIFAAMISGGSGTALWSKRFGTAGSDLANDAVVYPNTNLGLVGYATAGTDFGTGPLFAPYAILARFDSTGTGLSVSFPGVTTQASFNGLATNAAGDSYIVGDLSGTVNFGSGPLTPAGGTDLFVLRLDATNTPLWSVGIGGTGADSTRRCAVTAADNLAYGGTFSATVDFDPTAGVANRTSAGGLDGFVSQILWDGTW